MHIYNTMTKKKEKFVPQVAGRVGMYACGITAYDLCHIGHARSAVVFDVIARYLEFKGNQVTFVRNFTDVDDKIINRANQENVSSKEISERYIAAFHEDMDKLNVRRGPVVQEVIKKRGKAVVSLLCHKGGQAAGDKLPLLRQVDAVLPVDKPGQTLKIAVRDVSQWHDSRTSFPRGFIHAAAGCNPESASSFRLPGNTCRRPAFPCSGWAWAGCCPGGYPPCAPHRPPAGPPRCFPHSPP